MAKKKAKVTEEAPPAVEDAPPTEAEKLETLRSLVVSRLIERLGDGKKVIASDLTAAVTLLREVKKNTPAAAEQPHGDEGDQRREEAALSGSPEGPGGSWSRLGAGEGSLGASGSGPMSPDDPLYLPFPLVSP